MNSVVKSKIREWMEENVDYNGDPIDDYMEYHPPDGEWKQFGQFFGSIVYAMTPIGDVFYFKVKDSDGGLSIEVVGRGK